MRFTMTSWLIKGLLLQFWVMNEKEFMLYFIPICLFLVENEIQRSPIQNRLQVSEVQLSTIELDSH